MRPVLLLVVLAASAAAQPVAPTSVLVRLAPSAAEQVDAAVQAARRAGPTPDVAALLAAVPALDAAARAVGVTEMRRVFRTDPRHEARHRAAGLDRWYVAEVPAGAVDAAVARLGALAEVEVAEPNAVVTLDGRAVPAPLAPAASAAASAAASGADGRAVTPNDPRFVEQWHYHNTGQTGGRADADLDLPEAWAVTMGTAAVVVHVNDGGVDLDHPDLAGALWTNPGEIAGNGLDDDQNGYVDDVHGWSFVKNSADVDDPDGHGTHVSGTIGAVTNNGVGVAGIAGGTGAADGVRILTTDWVDGRTGSLSAITAGMVYAADNGAVVSNNSHTGATGRSASWVAVADYFGQNASGALAGGLVVSAAGNDRADRDNEYDGQLYVASTGHADRRASYSAFGTAVDVSAPGGETSSQSRRGVLSTLPGGYGFYQGTSMAAPHVAGLAALYASANPGATAAQARAAIEAGADAVDVVQSLAYVGKMGSGRINAARTLGVTTAQPYVAPTLAVGAGPGSVATAPDSTEARTVAVANAAATGAEPLQTAASFRSLNGVAGALCGSVQTVAQGGFDSVETTVAGGLRMGQSVTAPCAGALDAVSFSVWGPSAPGEAWTAVLRVFEGAGAGGAEVAAVPVSGTNPSSGAKTITVALAAPVALVAGATYSVFVDVTTGRVPLLYSGTDPYLGGDRYRTTGTLAQATVRPGEDLAFTLAIRGPSIWASASAPASVAAGASGPLAVAFDAAGLAPGRYTVDLVVSSNDPVTPQAVVPLALEVGVAGVVSGGRGWRLVGPPADLAVSDLAALNLVQGVPGQFGQGQPNLIAYASGAGWSAPASTAAVVERGTGVAWYFFDNDLQPDPGVSGGGTGRSFSLPMALVGPCCTAAADVPAPLATAPDGAGERWTLLANPFGEALRVSELATWAGADGLASAEAQVYDPSGPTYRLGSDVGSVEPWEAFWVLNGADPASTSLTIPESERISRVGGDRQRADARPRISLSLHGATPDGGALRDQAAHVVFDDGAQAGPDRLDAPKLAPFADAFVLLGALADGATQALAAVPTGTAEVAFSVQTVGAADTLRVRWPRLDVPDGWAVTLRDLATGAETDLRTADSYAFTHAASGSRRGGALAPGLGADDAPARLVLAVRALATAAEGAEAAEWALSVGPNPTRGAATLRYGLPAGGHVRLAVFDVLGREVAVLHDGRQSAGEHAAALGAGLAPGVYVVRLAAGGRALTRAVTVVR